MELGPSLVPVDKTRQIPYPGDIGYGIKD